MDAVKVIYYTEDEKEVIVEFEDREKAYEYQEMLVFKLGLDAEVVA